MSNTVASVGLFGFADGLHGMTIGTDEKKWKIVCVIGHPDDPESACGGTLAKLAAAGTFG